MLTKMYRRFYIVHPLTFEEDGYVCVKHGVIKYYGRNYIKLMERKNDN